MFRTRKDPRCIEEFNCDTAFQERRSTQTRKLQANQSYMQSLECMEKIIVKELITFFLENNLLPSSQHGFLPKRSTATNLLECLNDWTQSHDNGQLTDIIYLHYEKAFDKVPHSLLIAKLEHFGVRGKLLDLIKALLYERFYQVRVNGELSSSHRVSSGVVQGSVVGPVLFTAYLFDLVELIKLVIKLFADDCKIYANPLTSAELLQADLQNIERWSKQWGMKQNTSKCIVLRIGPNNPNHEYHLNECALKSVNEQSDLGVLIISDIRSGKVT